MPMIAICHPNVQSFYQNFAGKQAQLLYQKKFFIV